jgi:ZIP family zinc transporter
MPLWLQAWFWGLVGGSALLLGAAVGYFGRIGQRIIGGIMAFGGGVLISALAFELMDKAHEQGGFHATAIGFVSGAVLFSAANMALARHGAKHRKRSGHHEVHRQPSEAEDTGSGLAIAIGALLDGIPESIAIGVGLLLGESVGIAMVAAVFLSNVPEALSSSSGMKRAGRSSAYIFGVWGGIALLASLASLVGYLLFGHFSLDVRAATIAFAAGAILAMLADTMIPEAFHEAHEFAGLITVLGFLTAFMLTKLHS